MRSRPDTIQEQEDQKGDCEKCNRYMLLTDLAKSDTVPPDSDITDRPLGPLPPASPRNSCRCIDDHAHHSTDAAFAASDVDSLLHT
mmetsp:Transcript_5947/g.11714  ORF Transcript_5947/g.11714 Transcript_5947/m.11714 type:complete len:86 (-) Transcript_5947:29-286(-)